jgi:hypothetical protein
MTIVKKLNIPLKSLDGKIQIVYTEEVGDNGLLQKIYWKLKIIRDFRQIYQLVSWNSFSLLLLLDTNIEASPSVYPKKKYCDLTGFVVRSQMKCMIIDTMDSIILYQCTFDSSARCANILTLWRHHTWTQRPNCDTPVLMCINKFTDHSRMNKFKSSLAYEMPK